jgi:hypothetical protein
MPSKALCPQPWGQRVGGVSERPAREAERSDPFTCPRCNGGRHPDPRDAGSLRGLPEERGSWSVRLVCMGLVPVQADLPATAGALWTPRRGTSSAYAKRTHSSGRRLKSALHARGHVLRSVQRPVHVNRHSTPAAHVEGGGAVDSVSRSGKPAQAGGTGTGIETIGRMRGSPRVTASRGNSWRSCVTRQRRKVVMATVPARKRELRLVSVRRGSCRSRQAASWPRISSHAALQKEWRCE